MKYLNLTFLKIAGFLIIGYLIGFFNSYCISQKKFQTIVQHLSKEYIYGVPPPPPFIKNKLKVKKQYEDCELGETPVIGYIIEVEEDKDLFLNFSVIVQDTNGRRDRYYFNGDIIPGSENDIPASILIPGNKVRMIVEYCGSGNIPGILEIETLPRKQYTSRYSN